MSYQIFTEDHDDGPAWTYTMKPEPTYNEQWFQYPEPVGPEVTML